MEGYWESSINETKPLTPSFSKIDYSESFRSRTAVSFRFHPQRNLNMLYAPSIPLAFSRPVKIMSDLVNGKPADVTSVTITPMVRAGETYEVVSMIASPTVLQLQQAGTIYPEWTDKYLQLPSDLPRSIRELADQITVGLDNPYDKAEAVHNVAAGKHRIQIRAASRPTGERPHRMDAVRSKAGFLQLLRDCRSTDAAPPGHPRPLGSRLRSG